MTKARAFAMAGTAIAAVMGGYFVAKQSLHANQTIGAVQPLWTEVKWPFPADLWGPGKAFRCKAADCGSEVHVYVRAKIGFCNCTTAIDDDMGDRVSDVELLGGQRTAVSPGKPINVRWMKGHSRGYAVDGTGASAKSALSIAFHDRCDLIVATAAIGDEDESRQEDVVLELLNSERVLHWVEMTLGL